LGGGADRRNFRIDQDQDGRWFAVILYLDRTS
jgi:hypothetical protein